MTDITDRLRNPHAPYVVAVCSAMPDECIATDWTASDAETGSDGETCILSAVISWDDEASPELYPHGLMLCWDLEDGWGYAAMKADGSNEYPIELALPLWAAPQDVAGSVRALLAGEVPPPASLPPWRHDAVMAAVKAWRDL